MCFTSSAPCSSTVHPELILFVVALKTSQFQSSIKERLVPVGFFKKYDRFTTASLVLKEVYITFSDRLGKLDGWSAEQEGRKAQYLFYLKKTSSMAVSSHKGNHKQNSLVDKT